MFEKVILHHLEIKQRTVLWIAWRFISALIVKHLVKKATEIEFMDFLDLQEGEVQLTSPQKPIYQISW